MAAVNKDIASFFKEVTRELLCNILLRRAKNNEVIVSGAVREEFETKFSHDPMLFGLGYFTGVEWNKFLPHSSDNTFDMVRLLEMLADHKLGVYNSVHISTVSAAEYRERLLTQACKLLVNIGNVKDPYGNTPLHLVAGLPGINIDKPALLEYLLDAGEDPMIVNKQGVNLLHIIAGRLKAEVDDEGDLYFEYQHVNPDFWETGYRKEFLDVLSKKLSPAQLRILMRNPGRNGNTALHEWALATSALNAQQQTIKLVSDELEIASRLLHFDNTTMLQNQSGLFPLHFASNSTVFKFLVNNGANCCATSGQNESPVLFILKYLVVLVFINTPAFMEVKHFLFKDVKNVEQSLEEAVIVLGHLLTSLSEHEEFEETLWIPDVEKINPLEIVLVSIRCASYTIDTPHLPSDFMNLCTFRDYLVALLHRILNVATPENLRQKNKKGQTPLHILLDLSSSDRNTIHNEDAILQSLQTLLDHGIDDANAMNARGQTVMDIIQQNSKKVPAFSGKCLGALQQAQHGVALLGSTSSTRLQESLSDLGGTKTNRKLRWCVKYHEHTAQRLMKVKKGVTTVGKYRYFNHEPIGSGAFSSIYVAIKDEHMEMETNTTYCRAMALKRLEKGKINPQEIKREVQALLSISTSCENILNCYESFEDEFFHYLSLDLMIGDLRHFIGNRTATAEMMKNLEGPPKAAKDIINGLIFLHERDYLHRDLKPDNILYTTEPSLHFKIGDFGLAKNVSTSATMTATKGAGVAAAPGTRCWMAPELITHSQQHSKESDVFALGLVLHFLLTFGKHPFVSGDEEPTFMTEKKIAEMSMTIYPSLDKEASSLIAMFLAREPGRRVPAQFINQHPFFWSDNKKLEFLKAVGEQPEAANPKTHRNSPLEKALQKTDIARQFVARSWDTYFPALYLEATMAWKQKRYRTNLVIDLVRFIRNIYAHKEERSIRAKRRLENCVFLREFPSLVLEVFGVVQGLNLEVERISISQALKMA